MYDTYDTAHATGSKNARPALIGTLYESFSAQSKSQDQQLKCSPSRMTRRWPLLACTVYRVHGEEKEEFCVRVSKDTEWRFKVKSCGHCHPLQTELVISANDVIAPSMTREHEH